MEAIARQSQNRVRNTQKFDTIYKRPANENMRDDLKLIKDIGKVKKVRRAGWVREGIRDAESVADHSFRVAVMALVFGQQLGVDTNKLIKMALVHDIAEGIKGDKIVERGIQIDGQAQEQKSREEIETLRQIFADITIVEELINLQSDKNSNEGKVLRQLERLEMAVQALEYEEEYGKDLSEFFENASHHIFHPYLKEILETVKNLRPKHF